MADGTKDPASFIGIGLNVGDLPETISADKVLGHTGGEDTRSQIPAGTPWFSWNRASISTNTVLTTENIVFVTADAELTFPALTSTSPIFIRVIAGTATLVGSSEVVSMSIGQAKVFASDGTTWREI